MAVFKGNINLGGTLLVAVVVVVFLVSCMVVVMRISNEAKNRYTEQANKDWSAPVEANKLQINKIRIRRWNDEGEEIMEIDINGKVRKYNKMGVLVKTGQQGFAATRSLFIDIENWLQTGRSAGLPVGMEITIYTNQGEIVLNNLPGSTGEYGGGCTICDEINDFVNNTLNPTPTPLIIIGSSPTPRSIYTPIPSNLPNPSSLPDYLIAPPFSCEDYYRSGTKPIKISNIFCGFNENNR